MRGPALSDVGPAALPFHEFHATRQQRHLIKPAELHQFGSGGLMLWLIQEMIVSGMTLQDHASIEVGR